jgi:ATP-dependent Clp protease ATP-binding subunit ClpA
MLQKITRKFRDMATIKTLCERAESHARRAGQAKPGAEHFVLAAFDLPDGEATRAFAQLGASAADFANAIQRQYGDALQSVGIRAAPELLSESEQDPPPATPRLYDAQPSGQRLFGLLTKVREQHPQHPLSSAHVLLAATQIEHGVVARSLRAMDVEPAALAAAAAAQLRAAA